MKYLALCLLLTGCTKSDYSISEFKVGDCVRQLSYTTIKKVVIVNSIGTIETQNIKDGYLAVYEISEQNNLTKVKCEE